MGDVKEEKPTLDKAKTKKLMEDTIKRGPIPDEEFNPFFDQMPKFKKDAEPLDVYNAKECVVRFAIAIKMVPTRLVTALEKYVEEQANPERQIYDFFKNDCLADVTLIHPTTGALYRVHRVIIASGSRYMLEVFTKHTAKQLPRVKCPEPFNQKNELHSDDQVSRIIKYIYGNQVRSLIFMAQSFLSVFFISLHRVVSNVCVFFELSCRTSESLEMKSMKKTFTLCTLKLLQWVASA